MGPSITRRRDGDVVAGALVPAATTALPPLRSAKLLDQVRERIRFLHYSRRTEQAYVQWCRTFIRFHGLQHPRDLGGPEVEAFLTWLADERRVAPATHKQALSALVFLYAKVLGVDLPWMSEIGRPRTRPRLPVVLTKEEVTRILHVMEGEQRLSLKCSTARACACRRACSCESRMWISTTGPSSFARARAARIGW